LSIEEKAWVNAVEGFPPSKLNQTTSNSQAEEVLQACKDVSTTQGKGS
jgi:hypothetical protein